MTASEAFRRVEKALTDLQLKDPWGDPLVGLQVVGTVSRFSGGAWEKAEDDFQAGIISADQYADRMLSLIDVFGRTRQNIQVARRMQNLRLDQIELDVLKEVRSP